MGAAGFFLSLCFFATLPGSNETQANSWSWAQRLEEALNFRLEPSASHLLAMRESEVWGFTGVSVWGKKVPQDKVGAKDRAEVG